MNSELRVRTATVHDAVALQAIYRPYVESTAISFEITVPTIEEFSRRIGTAIERWSWLVAEIDERPIGYAYGTAHRPREAYRYSVETSAYVDEQYQRRGVARALYSRLFTELDGRGLANAYAGITLPNDASIGFHKSLGFKSIGVFPQVGRKFGSWHDVAWLHRPIGTSQ